MAARPAKPQAEHSQPFETVTRPGVIHRDGKYLTTLKGRRACVYVAIDRVTRYGYVERRYDLKRLTVRGFIERFLARFPLKARALLTDNGMAWTDRCHRSVKVKPTGRHPVNRPCKARHI